MWFLKTPILAVGWLVSAMKKLLQVVEDVLVVFFQGCLELVRRIERRFIVRERWLAEWLEPYLAFFNRLIPWSYLHWIERIVVAGYLATLQLIQTIVERLVPKPIRDAVYWVLFPFIYLIHAGFVFLWAWVTTRSIWSLLGGIPAMALAAPFIVAVLQLSVRSDSDLAERYRNEAKEAFRQNQPERALLYREKVSQLGFLDQDLEFDSIGARLARQTLKVPEAYEEIRRLAPEDYPDYGPAHIWIAQQIAFGKLDLPRETAERHLQLAEQIYGKHPKIQSVHAMLVNHFEGPAPALKEMQDLAQVDASFYLESAMLAASQGNLKQAQDLATLAERHYRNQSETGLSLIPEEYVRWMTAAEMTQGFLGAEEILLQGLKRTPDSQPLLEFAAGLYSRWLDSIGWKIGENGSNLPVALRCLPLLKPENQEILIGKFADLVVFGTPDESAKAARMLANLARAADEANLSTQLHAQIADAFLKQGVYRLALDHYRVVAQREPDDDLALNNIAWLEMQNPDGDLQAALKAVNRALELSPNNGNYLETRGSIYFRMKDYPNALLDLEAALPLLPEANRRQGHEMLTKIYASNGNRTRAEWHRAESSRLVLTSEK